MPTQTILEALTHIAGVEKHIRGKWAATGDFVAELVMNVT